MSKAIVDPGELRRFAHTLKQFNNDLQAQMSALHGQLVALSQTWRDQEQRKFTEEFEQTMKVMARFVDVTNEHIPFLLRKAQRVEEYLQQR
jgi:WXG100 family type VII secretion target